ncbi:unnamed protein product [Protopolystoma xenopodis]|uniref:Uncharacterized protein n=1 Tax=Protopolystoma xenopodis TaxID=117903 RepID=A0A448WG28_9PLAT|nr:unnamed protein product [Protopolystoma xenopodis]
MRSRHIRTNLVTAPRQNPLTSFASNQTSKKSACLSQERAQRLALLRSSSLHAALFFHLAGGIDPASDSQYSSSPHCHENIASENSCSLSDMRPPQDFCQAPQEGTLETDHYSQKIIPSVLAASTGDLHKRQALFMCLDLLGWIISMYHHEINWPKLVISSQRHFL